MTSVIYTYQNRESTIDFDGHISILLFTRGCNFRCRYCHNKALLDFSNQNLSYEKLDVILERAKRNWADAVCITGGEPCAQENLPQTAAFIKNKGFALKIDTNGSFPNILKETAPFCDYIAMDYKMPAEKYQQLTKTPVDIRALNESLNFLKTAGIPYEVRTTIVPGLQTEDDMRLLISELSGIRKLALQGFIPRAELPDTALSNVEKTPRRLLESYAEICRPYFEELVLR